VTRAGGGSRASRIGVGLAAGAAMGLVAVDLNLAALGSVWADPSAVVPIAAALTAFAWLTPLRRAFAALATLAVALWLVVAYTPLAKALSGGLVRRDPPRAADAVFVFGSQIRWDGDPTADAMSRLLEGLRLVAQGHTHRVVVSEQTTSAPYAPIARAWARDFAPGTEIVAVGPIANTHDEAMAVGRLFRERGWKRVLAVSSPVHTRRAAAALENEGLEVIAVPSIETRYDLVGLDRPSDRRRGFSNIVHERIGLLFYERRGWIR